MTRPTARAQSAGRSIPMPWHEIINKAGKPIRVKADRLCRYARPPFHQPEYRGPNNRPLCRWCWNECPTPKRTWCGPECLLEYRSNFDWSSCRRQVEQRDHGICAICGTDTIWLKQVHLHIRKTRDNHADWLRLGQRLSGLRDIGRDWWEADHIHARHDGGSDHPENLRTLCIQCHRTRTKQQATERSLRRRHSATPGLFST